MNHRPSPLQVLQAKDVTEYIRRIEHINTDWSPHDPMVWYRGVSSNKHTLLPGAYRDNARSMSIFVDFVAKAHPLVDPRPSNNMEWYFVAQHYGVPTRLLDWTENPLVALYFAVRSPKPGSIPCVWMMNADSLNQISIKDPWVIMPDGTPDDFAYDWSPDVIASSKARPRRVDQDRRKKIITNRMPLAISPAHATRRVVAQAGLFTIHGTGRDPIESVFAKAPQKLNHLTRVDLVGDGFLKSLNMLGYDDFSIFPEPAYLATSLIARYASRRPIRGKW